MFYLNYHKILEFEKGLRNQRSIIAVSLVIVNQQT